MNVALPILLLVFGGLTFWILAESKLKWYVKTVCISVFCLFTVIFWATIHTFLGWGANEKDLPKKILIHWVIIKEPNKFTKSNGSIYILLESVEKPEVNKISKFFGYGNKDEPRLYKLEYSRGLHEQLEEMKLKLGKGQPVVGELTKAGRTGIGKKGKAKADEEGAGSESQEQGWEFHELRPSEIQGKPER